MAKNKSGGLSGNLEWGSKARKEEDRLRGRNNSSRRASIDDQVKSFKERWDARAGEVVDCFYCGGTGVFSDDPYQECGFCDAGVHTLGT